MVTYRKSLVKTHGRDLNRLQKNVGKSKHQAIWHCTRYKRKKRKAFLSILLDGGTIDAFRVQETYDKKEITHNLKASNEQLADNPNGFRALFQRKLMKEGYFPH